MGIPIGFRALSPRTNGDRQIRFHPPEIRGCFCSARISVLSANNRPPWGILFGGIKDGGQSIPGIKHKTAARFQPTRYSCEEPEKLFFCLHIIDDMKKAYRPIQRFSRRLVYSAKNYPEPLTKKFSIPFFDEMNHGRIRIHRRDLNSPFQQELRVPTGSTSDFQNFFWPLAQQHQGLGHFFLVGLVSENLIVDLVEFHE